MGIVYFSFLVTVLLVSIFVDSFVLRKSLISLRLSKLFAEKFTK